MLQAKNEVVNLSDGPMDYIRFGKGDKTLVLLPGAGDGLKTVKGMALPFAMLYRTLARDYTVYVFSRKRKLPIHYTTSQMAQDLNTALNYLGLKDCYVVGVSQGGMIAQWLAIHHPDKVKKLVLAVTLARANKTIKKVVSQWVDMAKKRDYKGIMIDTANRSYSPKRLKSALRQYNVMGSMGAPKSFTRFMTQAESCITHDAYDMLDQITCPVLVIGGSNDKIVTGKASLEIADRIPGSTLYMYQGLGHGLYEEAPDFLKRIKDFFDGE